MAYDLFGNPIPEKKETTQTTTGAYDLLGNPIPQPISDTQPNAGTLLIAVVIAGSLSYGLWRMLGGIVKGTTPVATGRRWMNWVVACISVTFLTKVSSQLISGQGSPSNVIALWLIGVIFFGASAFAVGALVARFRGASKSDDSSLPAVQPSVAGNLAVTTTVGGATDPTTNVIDTDVIYAAIANEIETGATDKGLWTRLFAECDGDEKQTKVRYIRQRAEKLRASAPGPSH